MDSNAPDWPSYLPTPLARPSKAGQTRGILTQMDSARFRSRRMFVSPLKLWQVQWNFTEDQFEDFKDYFDFVLENGQHSFIIELDGTDRQVAFLNGQYSFERSDNVFTVSAVFEEDPSEFTVVNNEDSITCMSFSQTISDFIGS